MTGSAPEPRARRKPLLRLARTLLASLLWLLALGASARSVAAQDAFEPDDTPAQAQAIAPDAVLRDHTLDPAADVDWVKFDAVAGTTYVLWTLRTPDADTLLTLYGTDASTVLASSNTVGWPAYDSRISWTCPTAGTYYLKCASAIATGGPYQLALAVGGALSGTIAFPGAGVKPPYVSVYLWNADGGHWGGRYPDAGDGWAFSFGGLNAGDYQLEIVPYSGGEYLGQWYDNAADRAGATLVPVTLGATATADVTLALGGKVAGALSFTPGGTKPSSAMVWLYRDGAYVAHRSADAAHGWTYAIGALPTGTYTLFYDLTGGDYLDEWYDGASEQAAATPIEVTAGQTVTANGTLEHANITVSGTISFAGTGVRPGSVSVWLITPTGNGVAHGDATAANGWSYAISGFLPGDYRIRFTPYNGGDYFEEWFDNQFDQAAARVVSLAAGMTFRADAQLDLGGEFTGHVGFAGAGAKPTTVRVTVVDAVTHGERKTVTTNAAAGWRYTAGRFQPGPYHLYFGTADGSGDFVGEWFDNGTDVKSAAEVTLARSQTTTVDAQLDLAGKISGAVSFGGIGKKPWEVTLSLYRSGDYLTSVGTRAGVDWRYTFAGLVPGTYTLRASPMDGEYLEEWYNNRRIAANATPIALVAGQTATANIRLDPGAKITGTVSFVDGGELPASVLVEAYNAAGSIKSARARATGGWSYQIGTLAPGPYLVRFVPPAGGDYLEEWYDNRPDSDSAAAIAVVAGKLYQADARLNPAAQPNRAPQLDEIADIEIDEGRLLDLNLNGSDPDGDPVTYLAENLPAGAAFDPATGVCTWRPAYGATGVYPGVRFGVSDGEFTVFREMTITVLEHDPLLFSDTFDDGGAAGDPEWGIVYGRWTVTAGKKFASGASGASLAVVKALHPLANPFTAGRIAAKLTLKSAAAGPNGLLVFAYHDEDRYRYVRLRPGKIEIGQSGAWGGVPAGLRAATTVPVAVTVGTPAAVRVDVLPDGRVRVFLGDELQLGAKFPAPVAGGVGCASSAAVTLFDDYGVWDEGIYY